jgi:conjugal transfer ATP-binding protein TraC
MLAKVHEDFRRERLAPHFVYESYDESTGLFFNRASVGFVLLGSPLVGASLQAQSEIAEFLKDEENLPCGSSIQVLMIGSDQIDHFLDNWLKFRTEDIFKTLAEKRVEFFKKKAKEGLVKDVVILISVTIPDVKAGIEDMERRRDILKSTFRSIGLYTENVNDAGLIKYLRVIFGWKDKEEHPEINPYDLLSEQILRADFAVEEQSDKVFLGEEEAFISLEAVRRPKDWRLSLMDLFIGDELRKGDYIKSNYLIHLGVQILPNQAMEKATAVTKREILGKNLAGGLDKFFPDLAYEERDMDAAVVDLQSGGRMVSMHQNVILISTASKIKEVAFNYASMMRRVGWHFIPCNNDHMAIMLGSLPMSMVEGGGGLFKNKVRGVGVALRDLGRGLKTVSSETKALMPIVGEWKGDLTSPGMLLTGRRGQIMYFSSFGSALINHIQSQEYDAAENFNIIAAGVSGSGKSVLLQDLMWSILGIGGKVFVLDYGRSFKNSCLIIKLYKINAQYIEFDIAKPISINPFSEIPEGDDPKSAEARADFLGSFPLVLASMAAPQYGTSDLQRAMLQKALIEIWKAKGARSEISDIASWLLARDELYAKELGNMLFPFTRDGQYGKFFAGKAELSLNGRIVVIETDNLRNVPELMTVVIQMMMVHINHTMAKSDRSIPSLIIIDEMAKTLKSKKAGEFVDESSRIVRKYKTAIIVATQHLTDFFPREGGSCEKIFAGAAFKIILKQNADSLKAMRSIPQLSHFVDTDWKLNLMQSIHSVKHQYSEAAIFAPNVNGVVARLMIDPFNLLLYSTDANEYQEIENLTKRGMNLVEAIEDILKRRAENKIYERR